MIGVFVESESSTYMVESRSYEKRLASDQKDSNALIMVSIDFRIM